MPVKRGIADAVNRLYTERAFLRYDSDVRGVRFGDVIELVHPDGRPPAGMFSVEPMNGLTAEQHAEQIRQFRAKRGQLYRWAITTRRGRDAEPPMELVAIRARWTLNHLPPLQRHVIAQGKLDGLTEEWQHQLGRAMAGQWEWLHSWLGETRNTPVAATLSKAAQWRLVLPQLGYMALLRNLRNLDQAQLTELEYEQIMMRLSSQDEVRRSRQLPFRFYSAWSAVRSLRWGQALETALNHSLTNVPELPGRTLILIDTSASMEGKLSSKSQMSRVRAAALFAFALARKQVGRVDVFGFADGQFRVDGIRSGDSILRSLDVFERSVGRVGHGTRIEHAVTQTFQRGHHDRVVIFTDMQTFPVHSRNYYMTEVGDIARAVPPSIPVYGFNLAGYANSGMAAGIGNRHELGGLTDHTFSLIVQLEAAQHGRWPWETPQAVTA